ncbi:hypothetical protein [Verrucomicrobium sp. GAS474]|uniref:hypothetical protein n=1 Tax=Verrucomicrobium sp. GAS474 TaxID=1882831 RepID=UPI000B87BBE2|nr:hypothetical protein [Verrucomicrobium sp. GAS474]
MSEFIAERGPHKARDVARDLSSGGIPRFWTDSETMANQICDRLRESGFTGKRRWDKHALAFVVTCEGKREVAL